MAAKLRVTLVKSPISHTSRTRGTVRALGLHRLGETVEVPDNPQMRGMTRAVRFLLQTDEIESESSTEEQPAAADGTAEKKAAPEKGTAAQKAPAARRRTKKEESKS